MIKLQEAESSVEICSNLFNTQEELTCSRKTGNFSLERISRAAMLNIMNKYKLIDAWGSSMYKNNTNGARLRCAILAS